MKPHASPRRARYRSAAVAARRTGLVLSILLAWLVPIPEAARAQVTIGGLPDGRIEFEFEAYANNVRVLPPLVGEWQLGISRFSGSGVIEDGRVSGTVRDVDNLTMGTRSMSANIVDGTYQETGNARVLRLTVEITSSSHPGEECAPGTRGILEIVDSPDPLPNGEPGDWVRIGNWNADCRTHVHGWNNEDPGPRTRPQTGGPRDGGQWAIVEIGGSRGGLAGTGAALSGASGRPLDLIIAFDLTSSMASSIESLKARTADLVRRAQATSPDFRLGLVTYRDVEDEEPFWERPLGRMTAAELEGVMAGWRAVGGGDHPEDMGEALSRAIAMWESEGATARKPVKLVIVVTDAPGKWPDTFGNTRESIASRAYAVDPAHVYPVIVGDNAAALRDGAAIAEKTGGRLLRADEPEKVADAVLEAVEEGVRSAGTPVAGGGGPVGPRRGGAAWGVYALVGGLFLMALLIVALVAIRRGRAAPGTAIPAPQEDPGSRVDLSLELTGPDGRSSTVHLDRAPAVLGRDPVCDVVIDDPSVSRRHARIEVADGELFLVDLGSAAGVLADGRPESRVRLRRGVRLTLGDTDVHVL